MRKRAKSNARKIQIAQKLRAETAVTLKWIAAELHMGTWTHLANRLHHRNEKTETGNQNELGLL